MDYIYIKCGCVGVDGGAQDVALWCNGSSDRSLMVDPLSSFCDSQCSMTGVTKDVVSYLWDDAFKRTFAAN